MTKIIRDIKDIANKRKNDIVDFIRELIISKPVNPIFDPDNVFGESKCQKIIADKLSQIGFEIEEREPSALNLKQYKGYPGYTDSVSFSGRKNVLAKLPGMNPSPSNSLILTGHSDVIGVDLKKEKWLYDPWAAELHDENLFGRGSVDMLSGLGCMIMAIDILREMKISLDGDIWFGSVVGEETGGMGMLDLANTLHEKNLVISAGIMGEPTDLKPSLLCRGILWGKLIIHGRSGHMEVKQPHWKQGGAVDSIEKGLFIINALKELNREWYLRPEKNHHLIPEPCQIKISIIQAGQHGSSYAEECEISFNIQFLPGEADEKGLGSAVKEEFVKYIQNISEADPWLRGNPPQIEWIVEADCAEVKENHSFVQVFLKSCQEVTSEVVLSGSGFHTDIGWLSRLCKIPMINFGPGNPAMAHRSNEHVLIEDLIKATQMISIACFEWCNQ